MEGISIIVCCYNSEGRIEKTLEYLSHLNLVSQTELILVDNNSTDDTSELVLRKWEEFNMPYPLKLVVEEKAGLSNARKKGVEKAKYSYVLFCDDDNYLEKNYLEVGYSTLRNNPQVGVLFGYSTPVFEYEPPKYIHEFLEAFAIGPKGLETGEVIPPRVPWGAGMWMPMEFLDQVWPSKRESKLVDRIGKSLSSGGDTELCYWAKELGYKWYFCKEMVFQHLVPEGRMKKSYLRELFYCFGEAEARIQYYYRNNEKKLEVASLRYFLKEKLYLLMFRIRNSDVLLKDELKRRRMLGFHREWLNLNEGITH